MNKTHAALPAIGSPIAQSILIFLILAAPALGALYIGKSMLSLVYIGGLAALVLLNLPRVCLLLYLLTLGFYFPVHMTGFAIHMYDVAALLLFGAVLMDSLLRTKTKFERTPFDYPLVFFIGAAAISLVFAHNRQLGLVPLVRLVLIYIMFRVVFRIALEINIRKILLYYIGLVTALSLFNCFIFISSGGKLRVFGPSGLGYEYLAMTALPMAMAFMIWAESRSKQFFFGLCCVTMLGGIFATQSRAPLLTVILAILALFIFSQLKATREQSPHIGKSFRKVIFIGLVASILIFVFSNTIFVGFLVRMGNFFESASEPQGTIALRIILWTAAIKGFLTAPFFGIGLGNFHLIEEVVPGVKAEPLWYYVRQMSAHNVLLHYMVECGMLGGIALLAIVYSAFKTSYGNFKAKLSPAATQVNAALFIAMFVFCITVFYTRAWTWEQGAHILSLIFGMSAALKVRIDNGLELD
ncbi:MAG: O-antigen ligase family protein [candidate division Zixibacteria bacterium]|nr:O-antigen ligase family protein [candidate division Zixibacteria bacterium]